MHKCLYKILFVIISFSFFISATEMDLGECHNTFFDDYDTYVQSEQISYHSVVSIETDYQTSLHSYGHFYSNLLYNNKPANNHQHCEPRVYSVSQKIFLRNSVWRI